MTKSNISVYETLRAVNVNDKVEKKNGLSYLSWAWAWSVVKEYYPESTYTIYKNETGWNYHHDGRTAWVETGVTIEGVEYIEMLPVMNYRNQSIKITEITSYDVNKTIQRSLTKAIARHGLGLYIYSGEDLPESKEPSKPTKYTLDIGDANWGKVVRYMTSNKSLGMERMLTQLKKKYEITAPVKKELVKLIKDTK